MALIASPKARGAVEGAVKSIGPTAENISQNAGPVSRAAGRAVGTGAGFKLGGYPGAAAGAMAGGELGPVLLHPIEMAKGMGQGAMEGASGKPIIPNFVGQPQARLSGNATPEPETPFGRGGLRVNAGPAESGEYFRDKNAPLPQVQRSNNVTQMPGPQEFFRDRNAPMPRIEPPLNSTGTAGARFNPSPAQGSSSPVTFEEIKNIKLPSVKPPTMPKIVEQQVSPALKSVDEPLPGKQLEEAKEDAPKKQPKVFDPSQGRKEVRIDPKKMDSSTFEEWKNFRNLLKTTGDNLGFDSTGQAIDAILMHNDWPERWDIQDPKLIQLGNKFAGWKDAKSTSIKQIEAPKSSIGPKTQAALDKVKKVDFKPARENCNNR